MIGVAENTGETVGLPADMRGVLGNGGVRVAAPSASGSGCVADLGNNPRSRARTNVTKRRQVHRTTDSVSDDDIGSVETNAEYENWSVSELDQRKDNLVQDKRRIQELAKGSDKEKDTRV